MPTITKFKVLGLDRVSASAKLQDRNWPNDQDRPSLFAIAASVYGENPLVDWPRQLTHRVLLAASRQRLLRRTPTSASAANPPIRRPWPTAHRTGLPERLDPVTPPAIFADINDPNPRADMAHPILRTLATLNTENALPMEPTEPTLPTEPIDSVDERLQILSSESSDAMDHRDAMTISLSPRATDFNVRFVGSRARRCQSEHGVRACILEHVVIGGIGVRIPIVLRDRHHSDVLPDDGDGIRGRNLHSVILLHVGAALQGRIPGRTQVAHPVDVTIGSH